MGKSEGEVLPCHECGSQMVKYEYGVYDVYECKNNACGMIGKFRDLRYHNKPIHPARLAAEGLVPAAALDELVKAAHEEGALAMAHYYHGEYATEEFKKDHGKRALRPEHLEWAKSALAHAREIAKGGK